MSGEILEGGGCNRIRASRFTRSEPELSLTFCIQRSGSLDAIRSPTVEERDSRRRIIIIASLWPDVV
jgi:hypothetical protein